MLDRSSLAWHQPSHPNFLSARSFLAAAWYSALQPALLLLYKTKHSCLYSGVHGNIIDQWSCKILHNTIHPINHNFVSHCTRRKKYLGKKQNYIGFITLNYQMLCCTINNDNMKDYTQQIQPALQYKILEKHDRTLHFIKSTFNPPWHASVASLESPADIHMYWGMVLLRSVMTKE